jgi:hypothetical protein
MWVKEIWRDIFKYLELNENEGITYQNFWYTIKWMLRREFTALNSYVVKEERCKINKLNFHLRWLDKLE